MNYKVLNLKTFKPFNIFHRSCNQFLWDLLNPFHFIVSQSLALNRSFVQDPSNIVSDVVRLFCLLLSEFFEGDPMLNHLTETNKDGRLLWNTQIPVKENQTPVSDRCYPPTPSLEGTTPQPSAPPMVSQSLLTPNNDEPHPMSRFFIFK